MTTLADRHDDNFSDLESRYMSWLSGNHEGAADLDAQKPILGIDRIFCIPSRLLVPAGGESSGTPNKFLRSVFFLRPASIPSTQLRVYRHTEGFSILFTMPISKASSDIDSSSTFHSEFSYFCFRPLSFSQACPCFTSLSGA